MADVAYYHKHYDDPAFLFTPDAEFPVCYGEKGGYDGELISKPIADRIVLEFTGGARHERGARHRRGRGEGRRCRPAEY